MPADGSAPALPAPIEVGALGRGGQSIRIVPEFDLVVRPRSFKIQYGVFMDVLRAISPPG